MNSRLSKEPFAVRDFKTRLTKKTDLTIQALSTMPFRDIQKLPFYEFHKSSLLAEALSEVTRRESKMSEIPVDAIEIAVQYATEFG